MPRRHSYILLAVFLLSVLVRIPQLGRPLSKHHEFCTAVALIVMEVWWQRGFTECLGSPAATFAGPCDSAAGSFVPDDVQRAGVRYYISHMPLAYWVPFAVFKALGIPPAPLPLRLFNLILHGLTAFFLYRFLATVVSGAFAGGMAEVPLLAAVFYLLMPAPLWYHGNVYMSDMAVQLPWAWSLAAAAKVFSSGSVRVRAAGWLLLAIAATALTEWMGLFTAVTFGGYAILRGLRRNDRSSVVLGVLIPLVAMVVMAAVLVLYAHIAGPGAEWDYFTDRWASRGSFVPGEGIPSGTFVLGLPVHVIMSFGPLVLLIAVGILRTGSWGRIRGLRSAWWWMTLPAVMHIVVFLRYTGHEFSVLCLGFTFCTWAAFVLVRWKERDPVLGLCTLVTTCLLGIALYTMENRPGDGSATGNRYDQAMKRGQFIAANARSGEHVYVAGAVIEPQLIWYARRNLSPLSSVMDSTRTGHGPCPEVHFVFSGDACKVIRPE